MAVNVRSPIDRDRLEEVLRHRGWRETTFNGRRAFSKDGDKWVWVAVPEEAGVSFLSLPSEDRSDIHSRGVRALLEEVADIGKEAGFSLPLKEEVGPWRS